MVIKKIEKRPVKEKDIFYIGKHRLTEEIIPLNKEIFVFGTAVTTNKE